MSLIVKRSWNPTGSEKTVLDHLKRIFKHEKEDIYLFHNVLIDHFKDSKNLVQPIKPDFILVSKSRGIAIIEVKSWEDFSLNGDHAILKKGQIVLNPLITAQNYYFNFHKIIKSRNNECELMPLHLKSHIVFTNQIHNPDLMGRFFESHFMNYTDTLEINSIFNDSPLSANLFDDIMSFLDPSLHFNMNSQTSHLDEKQAQIISKSPYGHYLVSGVPGSGKSILVVSRALYLKEVCPDWKILILCSNRNLSDKHQKDLEQRTGNLVDNIECQTYISFIADLCDSKDEELSNQKNTTSYSSKLKLYREKAIPKNEWDAIIVDEYQDFTDKDFEIILNSCKKHEAIINKKIQMIESLFLAGDMLQKIREEGCSYSWEKMNIHITGRSTILKNSYRCMPEILNISLQYLKSYNKTLEAEVNKFYEGTDDIQHSKSQDQSMLFSERWWEEEITEMYNSIQQLIANGVQLSNIILIAPKSHHGPLFSFFKKEIKNGLILATPHTVKGLEASYIFVFNLSSMLHRMQKNPTVKARMVYMLMTRGNFRVFVNSYRLDEDFIRLKKIACQIRSRKIA